MEFDKIINEIMEVYNLNASEFAEKIGVQRSNISHILSGRNKPSLDFLIKLKSEFEELRWDYLLLGKKPMTEREHKDIHAGSSRSTERGLNENFTLPPSLLHPDETANIREIKEEEPVPYLTGNAKQIKKIIMFYTDNSFEIFENT